MHPDPADISTKDGPTFDQNASWRHQEQRSAHGVQSGGGPLYSNTGDHTINLFIWEKDVCFISVLIDNLQ